MIYKIKKSGNSTTLTIPPFIKEKMKLKVGDIIENTDYDIISNKIIFTIKKKGETNEKN